MVFLLQICTRERFVGHDRRVSGTISSFLPLRSHREIACWLWRERERPESDGPFGAIHKERPHMGVGPKASGGSVNFVLEIRPNFGQGGGSKTFCRWNSFMNGPFSISPPPQTPYAGSMRARMEELRKTWKYNQLLISNPNSAEMFFLLPWCPF